MKDEIEIVSNGKEIAIFGKKSILRKFVNELGISDDSVEMNSGRLAKFVGRVAHGFDAGSKIAEASGRWLLLTEESARKLRESELIKSKKHGEGVFHIMLGKPGEIASWLQAEVGNGTLFTNPAVLSGISNYLAQQSLQLDQKQIQDMLKRIDSKLDDQNKQKLNEYFAKLDSVIAAVQDAKTKMLHNDGIVNSITWSQLHNQGAVLSELHAFACREMDRLKEKAMQLSKAGKTASVLKEIEKELAVWLQVLGRVMELRTELAELELAAVESIHPSQLMNHSNGVRATLESRRLQLGNFLVEFVSEIAKSTEIAVANVILHKPAAVRIVKSISNVEAKVMDFSRAIDMPKPEFQVVDISWRKAWTNPVQRKVAAKEAGVGLVKVGALAAFWAVSKELVKMLKK
jgi:hypothetical protein